MKSFVIAGTQSGVGKTTIAIGLMTAFRKRGLAVQPFKVGPDFIDPSFHSFVCQRSSRNLDGWMLSREYNMSQFGRLASQADVAIIEGVMGLFDGCGAKDESGSTSEMAKWVNAPVILVLDASASARSVAAVVKGFESFDKNLKFAGVIFNKVAGDVHYQWLREAVESHCKVPVLGGIPRDTDLEIAERHLGLTLPFEQRRDFIEKLVAVIEERLDLNDLLERNENPLPPFNEDVPTGQKHSYSKKVRIAVARDQSFCFYYEDNFEHLEAAGAELVPFSPLCEKLPENIDGIYFGGGYPELYAKPLSENRQLIEDIQKFAAEGGMIYAECGGLIYMSQGIKTKKAESYELCGIFSFWTEMVNRCKLGYVEVQSNLQDQTTFNPTKGHYFHYSRIAQETSVNYGYQVVTSHGRTFQEGYLNENVLGSYIHLHFGSNPEFANFLIQRCQAKQVYGSQEKLTHPTLL